MEANEPKRKISPHLIINVVLLLIGIGVWIWFTRVQAAKVKADKSTTTEIKTPLIDLVTRSREKDGIIEVSVSDAAGVERKLSVFGLKTPFSAESIAVLLEYTLCLNLTGAAVETSESNGWKPYGRLKLGGKGEPIREVEMFKTPGEMLGYRLDGVSYTSENFEGRMTHRFTTQTLKQWGEESRKQPPAP